MLVRSIPSLRPMLMKQAAPNDNTRRIATAGNVRLGILVGIALLALLAGAWFFKRSTSGVSRSGSKPEKSTSVIRYADHSYDGKAWKKKYAAANMGNLSVLGIRAAQLDQILGANEDRIWILDRKGVVFRRTDGHWELAANQTDLRRPVIGLIDNETVLLGSRLLSPLFLVKPAGVRPVASDEKLSLRSDKVVTPIAPGLCYIHTGRQTYKLVEEKLTLVSPGDQKDSIVVDEFGAPVTISGRIVMTPNDFAYSAEFSPGEVYVVWMDGRYGARLVKYRDGAWVMLDEIPISGKESRKLTSGWISKDDHGKVFVVLGGVATAIVYRQGAGVMRYPIGVISGASLAKPIAIWGEGPKKFYLMDVSGSIWERSNDRWRPIVRGLASEKVNFNDAWVSPQGEIYAITNDSLYQLE